MKQFYSINEQIANKFVSSTYRLRNNQKALLEQISRRSGLLNKNRIGDSSNLWGIPHHISKSSSIYSLVFIFVVLLEIYNAINFIISRLICCLRKLWRKCFYKHDNICLKYQAIKVMPIDLCSSRNRFFSQSHLELHL